MRLLTSIILYLTVLASPVVAFSQQNQDLNTIKQTAIDYLTTQAKEFSDKVTVEVTPLDPKMVLPSCQAPQAFLPIGARLTGRTSVGVKCTGDVNWTIYLQANVGIIADYVAAASPIPAGQPITMNDITLVEGDLSVLPKGVMTDPQQVVGRTLNTSLRPGMPIRQEILRQQLAIQQGQVVRLLSAGPGFSVSMEGTALTSATEGQMVKAKTASGQVVTGTAKTGGIVEVQY